MLYNCFTRPVQQQFIGLYYIVSQPLLNRWSNISKCSVSKLGLLTKQNCLSPQLTSKPLLLINKLMGIEVCGVKLLAYLNIQYHSKLQSCIFALIVLLQEMQHECLFLQCYSQRHFINNTEILYIIKMYNNVHECTVVALLLHNRNDLLHCLCILRMMSLLYTGQPTITTLTLLEQF